MASLLEKPGRAVTNHPRKYEWIMTQAAGSGAPRDCKTRITPHIKTSHFERKPMLFRPLVILAALAMAASYFLGWMPAPLRGSAVPHDWLTEPLMKDAANAPIEVLIFAASFALAALLAVLGLMGVAPRWLAFLVGIIPVGLMGRLALAMRDGATDIGLPIPSNSTLMEAVELIAKMLEPGAWMYLGGAAVLLLLALIDPGKRRA